MEDNNKAPIEFNNIDISPHIKSIMWKVGIIIGALTVGYFLDEKHRRCLNFYGIMNTRLTKIQ